MERPGEETLISYFMGNMEGEEAKLVELYLAMELDQDIVLSCMKEAAARSALAATPLWSAGQQLAAWNKFSLLKDQQPAGGSRSTQLWKRVSVAAAVIFCLSVALLYHLSKPESPQIVKHSQPVQTDREQGATKPR